MKNQFDLIRLNNLISAGLNLHTLFNKILGVGNYRKCKYFVKLGLAPYHLSRKVSELPKSFRKKIISLLEKPYFIVGDSLRKKVKDRLIFLNSINNLRTFNYMNGLPVRGQRTKTNSRTAKRRVGRVRGTKVSPAKKKALSKLKLKILNKKKK